MKWKHIFILLMFLPAFSGFSQEKYTISGVITDSQSGKTLTGMDIVVENKNTGTISNQKGSFLLYLEEGKYSIKVSGKGYLNEEFSVELKDNLEQEVTLTPAKTREKKNLKRKDKKAHTQSTLLSLL